MYIIDGESYMYLKVRTGFLCESLNFFFTYLFFVGKCIWEA